MKICVNWKQTKNKKIIQTNQTKPNKQTPEQTTIKQQQQRLTEFELKRNNKEVKNRMATSDCKLHHNWTYSEICHGRLTKRKPNENRANGQKSTRTSQKQVPDTATHPHAKHLTILQKYLFASDIRMCAGICLVTFHSLQCAYK